MDTTAPSKRLIAALLPYRTKEGAFEYYLQKRSATARILQGKFSLFGGGVEGEETVHEGLLRELQEELEYTPTHEQLLGVYEGPTDIVHVYTEEVAADFEKTVVVHEGEYGTFIPSAEIANHPEVSALVKLVVEQYESIHHV